MEYETCITSNGVFHLPLLSFLVQTWKDEWHESLSSRSCKMYPSLLTNNIFQQTCSYPSHKECRWLIITWTRSLYKNVHKVVGKAVLTSLLWIGNGKPPHHIDQSSSKLAEVLTVHSESEESSPPMLGFLWTWHSVTTADVISGWNAILSLWHVTTAVLTCHHFICVICKGFVSFHLTSACLLLLLSIHKQLRKCMQCQSKNDKLFYYSSSFPSCGSV